MKVILLQNIPKLGSKNEVLGVSDGYARNFLFPRKLAKFADPATLRQLTLKQALVLEKRDDDLEKYRQIVEKLKSLVLKFSVKIGKKGRAFGSITAIKIRDALLKHGITVAKESIGLSEPIKTAGEHRVSIKFPRELRGEVKIVVETE